MQYQCERTDYESWGRMGYSPAVALVYRAARQIVRMVQFIEAEHIPSRSPRHCQQQPLTFTLPLTQSKYPRGVVVRGSGGVKETKDLSDNPAATRLGQTTTIQAVPVSAVVH
ncbi:hypothetical protein J6590_046823 [Homalodisca vitripennis]|nr:hypothetical protein J6590_046823 [Homalodisca vitripennis]